MTGEVKDVKLKNCPLCNSKVTMLYDNQEGYTIYCNNNNCIIETAYSLNKEELISKWNTRSKEQ